MTKPNFILFTLLLALSIIAPQNTKAFFGGGKDNAKQVQASGQTKSKSKAPGNCARPGDICADGTIFLGLFCPDMEKNLNTCALLYAPPYDQASLIMWKKKKNLRDITNDIKNDDFKDGSVNQGQLSPINRFHSAATCANFHYSGYSDWYLPSKKELQHLYINKHLVRNFKAQSYWSSTEYNKQSIWSLNFSSGAFTQQPKNQRLYVRCLRRHNF